jgi:DNA ligase-associated metallophosphoesterase
VKPDAALGVNGAELVADGSGALFWPARRTLMVADLHLEKGSAFAARGVLLPPYDTVATLRRLTAAIDRHRPERVVCLGDSFHDAGAAARLAPDHAALIARLTAAREWIWIAGNHDPAPPAAWGGEVAQEITLGPLVLRHRAAEAGPAPGEVSGHYHPKASVRLRGKGSMGCFTGRCFVTDGRRVILPAFGAYAGGLDVLDPAVAGLFPRGFRVRLLGRSGVYDFPKSALAPVTESLSNRRA